MQAARDVDEYIGRFPEEVRAILERLRRIVHQNAPGVREAISYGIPTFILNGNLVHFAAYGEHIGFYPTPSGIEAFRDRLHGYELRRGTVRFPLDREIPYDLIAEIVRYRARESGGA